MWCARSYLLDVGEDRIARRDSGRGCGTIYTPPRAENPIDSDEIVYQLRRDECAFFSRTAESCAS